MPIILKFTFEDGTNEVQKIPAEIWKMNDTLVTKVFTFKKPVKEIELDPFLETADIDRNNNFWPKRIEPTPFQLYKREQYQKKNPMQKKKKSDS